MKKKRTRLLIREIAEQQGWTQSSLGRAADINMQTIGGIWKDPYRRVSYEVLRKIANALQVPMDNLVTEEDITE